MALFPFDSPFLPLVTSISLLSSLYNYESLWVFLALESHFIINLGVLPSVLYGGKDSWCYHKRGPKPRRQEVQLQNSGPITELLTLGTLNRWKPTQPPHTYPETKLHQKRASKLPCKTPHARFQQSRNTTLNIKIRQVGSKAVSDSQTPHLNVVSMCSSSISFIAFEYTYK